MDRRQERRLDVLRERERQPVEVVVDEIELAGAAERVRDVQRLADAAVEPWIFRIAGGANAVERRRCERVERREERDVYAARDQSSAIRLVTCSHGP
jgi:hypothetical protein